MSLIVEKFVTTGFGWTTPSKNSQVSYRRHLLHFESFLKLRNKLSSDGTVVEQDISDYIEHLKSKYHQNTVAVKVAAIKSYFKWLKDEGTLTYKPVIRSQKQVKPVHKEMNLDDLKTIIKSMQGDTPGKRRDRAMFALMIYCGFKTEEIVAMNVEDVDFANGEIKVEAVKRTFRSAFTEIQEYAHSKRLNNLCWKPLDVNESKEPFFLNKVCSRLSGRSLRRRFMRGIDSHTMRDLRYTYLKNLNRIEEMEGETAMVS